jgi:hypothetical protein
MYRSGGAGWSFAGADYDSAGKEVRAGSRAPGRFALFRDTHAPHVMPLNRVGVQGASPYSTWALQARVRERGSGIDADETYFIVDGRRVPSEWDGESSVLRWRPRVAPARGRHAVIVVAVDRAGNAVRTPGRFVVN